MEVVFRVGENYGSFQEISVFKDRLPTKPFLIMVYTAVIIKSDCLFYL